MRDNSKPRIHTIMACHNRRALSVRSVLRALEAAEAAGLDIDFTVYDDGSTDGTADALIDTKASIAIVPGSGDAFWARGMSVAETVALREADASDFMLWLNDDVALDSDALHLLMACSQDNNTVVVGALVEPGSTVISYGGLVRNGRHPLNYRAVDPTGRPLAISTFNGNVVLVPVEAARRIGGIDGGFSHALADIDYGLRCRAHGLDVVLTPRPIGECPRNRSADARHVLGRWRNYIGVKGGGNRQSIKRFLLRHHPTWWPTALIASYALWWFRELRRAAGLA